jgi:hypothetical protein
MVGHCATELLVGAQNEIERTPRRDPEMREAKNARSSRFRTTRQELDAKKQIFLRRVRCFYLTSPFIEPAKPLLDSSRLSVTVPEMFSTEILLVKPQDMLARMGVITRVRLFPQPALSQEAAGP